MSKRGIDNVGPTPKQVKTIILEDDDCTQIPPSPESNFFRGLTDAEITRLIEEDSSPEMPAIVQEDDVDNDRKLVYEEDTQDVTASLPNAQEHEQWPNHLFFKRVKNDIQYPVQKLHSPGFDLKAPFDFVIDKQSFKTVDLNIIIKIPFGKHGRIAGIYDLALEKGIDVISGIIGPMYRKTIKICVLNRSNVKVTIKTGDTIAQLIIEKHYTMSIEERFCLDYEDNEDNLRIVKVPYTDVINPA